MKPERRALSRLTLPLKVLADRFAFGALVILSLALLAVGKANVHLLEGVSMRISDALVPALQTLMQPVTANLLEQLVFSKPYFDPAGLIIALVDNVPVGFVHAGFGANVSRWPTSRSITAPALMPSLMFAIARLKRSTCSGCRESQSKNFSSRYRSAAGTPVVNVSSRRLNGR